MSVEALPSAEALQVLLSPDGYYKYLSIEKPATNSASPAAAILNNGDGKEKQEVDADLVKKNYRRLSLKHHPDRKGGDADTFRLLNRAQKVLTTPKIRKQYDLVGLDLDDEEDDNAAHHDETSSANSVDEGSAHAHHESSNGADSVVSHLASAVIAGIMQAVVRTALMGFVATFLTRYKYLVGVAVTGLAFLACRIFLAGAASQHVEKRVALVAACPTLLIAFGLLLMYSGRGAVVVGGDVGEEGQVEEIIQWSYKFFLGEIIVMSTFIQNSIPTKTKATVILITIFSTFASLLLRGKFWRYASILGFQIILGIIAALAFPIMEMILEEVVNEKLRKVGEKVRAHNERMEKIRKDQKMKSEDID